MQHAALCRRLNGHFNYFGVSGNWRSLNRLCIQAFIVWFKWLRRRSQRTKLTPQRYRRLLEQYPLPRPGVTVRIWAPTS